MAYKGYHFRLVSADSYVCRWEFSQALKAFLVSVGWELYDTIPGVAAYTTLTATGNCSNGNTFTLNGITYRMVTGTPSTEGDIKIGANAAETLDNMKLAINRTDPETNMGVKYYVSAAHPTMEATTNTDTTQVFAWRWIGQDNGGDSGNGKVCSESLSNMSISGDTAGAVNTIHVYRSNGENGDQPYGHVAVDNNIANNYLELAPYQYWSIDGHSGTRRAWYNSSYSYSRMTSFSNTYECILAGNKNLVYASSYASTNGSPSNCQIVGHWPRKINTRLTTTTGAVASGSNVSVPVVSTTGFSAGMNVQILGVSEGCDRTSIVSVPDSTHMVLANVPRNYAAGAFLGEPASTFGFCSTGYGYWCPASHINDAGLTVGTTAYTNAALYNTSLLSSVAYDIKQLACPYVTYGTGINVALTDEYFIHTSLSNSWDVALLNLDDSLPLTSAVSSATDNSLTDTTKSWAPDALIGKWVIITSGTGVGQARLIVDNDATSVTVGVNWYTNPNATSIYKIADILYRAASLLIGSGSTWGLVKITNMATPS